jgi:hypothetical protein
VSSNQATMPAREFRYPRTFIVKGLIPSLVIAVILVLILVVGPARGPVPLGSLLGILGLFGFGIVFWAWPLIAYPRRIVLTDIGIEAESLIRRRWILRWHEVKSVTQERNSGFGLPIDIVTIAGRRRGQRIIIYAQLNHWSDFVSTMKKRLPMHARWEPPSPGEPPRAR